MKYFLFLIVGVFSTFAAAQRPIESEHCLAATRDMGWEVTEYVFFLGDEMNFEGWSSPHNTIIIRFSEEDQRTWSSPLEPDNSIGDWIVTSLQAEAEYGFKTFAVRDEEGSVFLVNDLGEAAGTNRCFMHRIHYWRDSSGQFV